jgi:chromosome segregation ATPase
MFRFIELEIHGWDFWPSLSVPMNAGVVILSGRNGSGKTTMLDAVRQLLHAPQLSHRRRISHYLRHPNQPALLRAVVSNAADSKGRRPFERQQILSDEATLACALLPNGGSPEKRFVVLAGRVGVQELQGRLLQSRDWLGPEDYRRVLEYAGVSRSLMNILALEQGRADELSRQKPRELFRWVMEARGSQQVLERYTGARRQYEDSVAQVSHQTSQLTRREAELAGLERQVRRLDEYAHKQASIKDAEAIHVASQLQSSLAESREIDRKLPEIRTKIVHLTSSIDRMQRELDQAKQKISALSSQVDDLRQQDGQAKNECDVGIHNHALLLSEVNSLSHDADEYSRIPEEDMESLSNALNEARRQKFAAEQRRSTAMSTIHEIEKIIADLNQGIPCMPTEVRDTLSALFDKGIECRLAAERIEVSDSSWSAAIESALGTLRFAISVPDAKQNEAVRIARRHGFPGPIVAYSETISAPMTAGVLELGDGVPLWLAGWGSEARLSTDQALPNAEHTINRDGIRKDIYGIWVSQVRDHVLGGNGVREQLKNATDRLATTNQGLADAEQQLAKARDEEADLEHRVEIQRRRSELASSVRTLPLKQAELAASEVAVAKLKSEREKKANNLREAEDTLQRAIRELEDNQKELGEREKELEGTRSTANELERKRQELEPESNKLRACLPIDLIAKAEIGSLPSAILAENDIRRLRDELEKFEGEGPIPDATVREQARILQRNVEELQQHVRDRQNEADAARSELDHCRGDYLEVIRSTLHDYSRRARALGELASAKVEMDLPQLQNDDRVIDEAGIVVRMGFDGKEPASLNDNSHSGGQQVVAGLVLLMSMAETEGESFFIVDEPFAHLSLDRVDDVGKFLRRSGAQFLITVPTTLDRGQLEPASLVISLRTKRPDEAFAPRPLICRS